MNYNSHEVLGPRRRVEVQPPTPPPALGFHWLGKLRAWSPDWLRDLRRQIPERGRAANMAAEHGSGQQLSQEMMEGEQPGGAATEGPRG